MTSSTPSATPGVTLFGRLASTTVFKSIIGTLVGGSIVLGGNQVFNTVNNATPKTQVTDGSTIVDTVKYSQTQTTFARPINGETNGTSSGIVLRADGLARVAQYGVPCTATGGVTAYDSCITRSPFASTGTLLSVSLECGNVPKGSQTVTIGYVSTVKTALTGTPIEGTVSIGSGSNIRQRTGTGATGLKNWNPANYLKANFGVTPGAIDCKMFYDALDKYGS